MANVKRQEPISFYLMAVALCVAVVAIVIVPTSIGFFPSSPHMQTVHDTNTAGFATLSINPPTQTVTVGDVLRLDITVSDITDLAGAHRG
jgi:hypothetical protein